MIELNHKELCNIAVKWLKRSRSGNGHGCQVAVSEVASGFNGEIPDAIGFRIDYEYEGSVVVEVKVSRRDFLADKKKPHRNGEVKGLGNWRYYMCPTDLIKPEELPDKWGLIYINKRGHCKLIVSPLLVDHYREYQSKLDAFRFDSNTNRELAMLTKLLARLGDPEKLNNMLKEERARTAHFERLYRKQKEKQTTRRKRQRNSLIAQAEENSSTVENLPN